MKRPWLTRRKGETESEQIDRLNRTCWWCGEYFDTVRACDIHEDRCKEQP